MATIISAGGIVSVMHKGECCIRVLRYSTGRLAFTKGRVEPGESLEVTALREVEEEAGLGELEIIQALGEVRYRSKAPEQSMHDKVMHLFLMTAGVRLHDGEEGACWVPLRDAMVEMELEGERDLLHSHQEVIVSSCSKKIKV